MQRIMAWLLKGVLEEMRRQTTELVKIAKALETPKPNEPGPYATKVELGASSTQVP